LQRLAEGDPGLPLAAADVRTGRLDELSRRRDALASWINRWGVAVTRAHRCPSYLRPVRSGAGHLSINGYVSGMVMSIQWGAAALAGGRVAARGWSVHRCAAAVYGWWWPRNSRPREYARSAVATAAGSAPAAWIPA